MIAYRRRIADVLLSEKLEAMGAVLIEGPKYCGKTTTALQQAKSVLFMADPEKKEQNITLVTTNISKLLSGEVPRLIDEWQIAPKLWDAVRFEVDRRGEDGQFILTGSAVPPSNDDIFHTGTGRFSWLTMRTMSLWESGDSSGDVSLAALFKNPSSIDGASSVDINRLAFLICRGGWPQVTQKKSVKAALMQAKEYYKAVTRSDISRVDGVARDPQRAERLMKSYARLQGAQAPVGTILADMKVNDEDTLNENTIYSYINALKKIFVIEDVPAWNRICVQKRQYVQATRAISPTLPLQRHLWVLARKTCWMIWKPWDLCLKQCVSGICVFMLMLLMELSIIIATSQGWSATPSFIREMGHTDWLKLNLAVMQTSAKEQRICYGYLKKLTRNA